MQVLMLGWEFPPFITGGLGTACYGLTRAMDRRGLKITFVLPKSAGGDEAEHVRLVSPEQGDLPTTDPATPATTAAPQRPDASRESENAKDETRGEPSNEAGGEPSDEATEAGGEDSRESAGPMRHTARPSAPSASAEPYAEPFRHVRFIGVPGSFFPPYEPPVHEPSEQGDEVAEASGGAPGGTRESEVASDEATERRSDGGIPFSPSTAAPSSQSTQHETHDEARKAEPTTGQAQPQQKPAETDYDGDMMTIVDRYAQFVVENCAGLKFDVIHAHDWMTYPAGMRIARATGKPLVVHIHSTEFDRSGEQVHPQIYDIERRGMHAAMRVIAVSQLTKNVVMNKYHLPDERVEVVYNGVDLEPSDVGITGIRSKDKIVLYFGRITYQKGPEFFIRAAKRVLEVMPDVKFVVAGSGDLAKRMIEMAAELGIGHKVLFTGFLRGHDIKRVFNLADLYVMPSISEPFGIAPLEAMSHNVPVLISRFSGVSEVLNHALKVDYWDVDDMANKIVAVLRHPPLSTMLKEHGAFEVRRLTWDGAAERCEQVYRQVIQEIASPVASSRR